MEFSAVNRRRPSCEAPLKPVAKKDGSFRRLALMRKRTTLVLTETHGLRAIIAVIVYMRRWYEKLQPKVGIKH